ncbi:hypothetical protein [Thiothrix fructosivorans]|uniref:hypothetical protein n=1 Tax=Thiothrix fructosivorans TaxID=111770 RepID=UPI001F5FB5E6|nr:hypothetical protein [Thiothrix fructosivorans]
MPCPLYRKGWGCDQLRGFHIAFLVTHLPGEVNLCGLPPAVASWSLAIIGLANVFGSLYAGSCVTRYRSK